MLELYLSDKYASSWQSIRELARSDEPEAFEKLKKYALEGCVSFLTMLDALLICVGSAYLPLPLVSFARRSTKSPSRTASRLPRP